MRRVFSNNDRYFVFAVSVDFIYDDLGLNLATNNLKAHLRTFGIVDILIQDLELNSIFYIEVRKDDCDRVARAELFTDALKGRARCLPLGIYRLLRYHQ